MIIVQTTLEMSLILTIITSSNTIIKVLNTIASFIIWMSLSRVRVKFQPSLTNSKYTDASPSQHNHIEVSSQNSNYTLTCKPNCMASTATLASNSGSFNASLSALAPRACCMFPRHTAATSRRRFLTHILAMFSHTDSLLKKKINIC